MIMNLDYNTTHERSRNILLIERSHERNVQSPELSTATLTSVDYIGVGSDLKVKNAHGQTML